MSLFTKLYPTIEYDPTGSGNTTKIQDILTRIIARDKIINRAVLFSKYIVKEFDTPESVSFEFYGNVKYYWTILMINKYYDRYYDWPLTERNLQKYVDNKYADPYAVHHYEISQASGNTTTKIKVELADEPSATPVSYTHLTLPTNREV